jgi:hypothetical protein
MASHSQSVGGAAASPDVNRGRWMDPGGLRLGVEVAMGYRMLAEVTMAVHFAFLVYVALGGFLAWRWPRTLWLHLVATVWGFATVLVGLACPLTYVEDWSRERAGQAGLPPGGFIDHYIEGVIYPQRYTVLVRWLMAAAIVASWLGAYLRWRARRAGPTLGRPGVDAGARGGAAGR